MSGVAEDAQVAVARARIGMVLQEKWVLESVCGIGGMAVVYAARHRNGKRVAIKMLHGDLSRNEPIRTRFLREGYAANTIQHDGAVSILDDDVAPDGSAFLVMELLDGETVEQRWERHGQRLATAEVLFIADQVLDVLAAAHAKNVVHRDVKPENLFLTTSGALKVLDFGIAKSFEAGAARNGTYAGMIMGTPAFMAPEQALGRWSEVDARTDLWAVGATMFTLLAGRHVHEAASNHEQLIASATRPAPPLLQVAPDAPAPVARVVDRALAFDRADRWPDATAMQSAVRSALDELGLARMEGSVRTGGFTDARRGAGTTQRAPVAATIAGVGGPGPSGTVAGVGGADRERERLRVLVGDLERRFADAKKTTAEARARVDAARQERRELEKWFHQQMGRRAAALEAAADDERTQLVALGRRALADAGALGLEADAAIGRLDKLVRAADAASRDVAVLEASLVAHDAGAFRRGLVLLALCAVVAFGLLAAPIAWRALRVVEPPPARPQVVQPR